MAIEPAFLHYSIASPLSVSCIDMVYQPDECHDHLLDDVYDCLPTAELSSQNGSHRTRSAKEDRKKRHHCLHFLKYPMFIIVCFLLVFSFIMTDIVENGHINTLRSCLTRANVLTVPIGSPDWIAELATYNSRMNHTPSVIVIARSIKHIQSALTCAAQAKVRVAAKSGGHSFGSYSLGGQDGHLVIVLDRMNQVELREDNTAVIQPGAKLGQVALRLHEKGRRAIAHGICPSVGIAGHVLHGGLGMATRTYGLALDWLTAAKLVLADGSVLYCSKQNNSDIFWALRGAGSSFGVVAELEFDTFEAPTEVTHFTYRLPWNEQSAVDGIMAIQDFITQAPKELNMMILMTTGISLLDGSFHGPESRLRDVLDPLLETLQVRVGRVENGDWISNLRVLARNESLEGAAPYHKTRSMYATNVVTGLLLRPQISSLMAQLFNTVNGSSGGSWAYMLEIFGGDESVVRNLPDSDSSFPHRDKLFAHQFNSEGSQRYFQEQGFSLLQGFRDTLTMSIAADEWGMYANYVDTQLSDGIAQKLYWSKGLSRLELLKAQVDPHDMFWNPQGVRPRQPA
ncbi:hypothetical protein NLG97_g6057 [Lecanicillium saksenae]|uniref:Uncharacterized protein n=1 Tax=Lecanicillium saksenae TaxID=468837 RepID=A0ACC1QQV7_9HYPO|nr:hypothetical protein NLG97_g6057 [Lecanicillium saksenae]